MILSSAAEEVWEKAIQAAQAIQKAENYGQTKEQILIAKELFQQYTEQYQALIEKKEEARL